MPNIAEAEIFAIQMTEQGSAPSTPAASKWKLYTKSTGLFIVDDAGVEYRLTTSAELAANNGIATLDGSGKVNTSQLPSLALTNVYSVASQVAQLALTTQSGDLVIRTDESKTYVRNSGSSGTMTDYTLLQTPTDVVLSVNGNIGTVVLDSDDIAEGSTNKYLSATDKTDLTDGGSSTLHYHATDRDRANHTGSQLAATISDFATAVVNALTGAISTVLTSNLTASKAVQSNASGKIEASTVTTTELGYLSGVTSAIQTQLGGKVGTGTTLTAGEGLSGGGDLSTNRTLTLALSELSTVTPTTSDKLPFIDVSNSDANAAATITTILALGGFAKIAVGNYTGNGTSQNVTGVGFQPKFIAIMNDTNSPIWTWQGVTSGNSSQTNGGGFVTTGITAIGADGFSVGALAAANSSGKTHWWFVLG